MSLPEADHLSIIGSWVRREAALDTELQRVTTTEIGRTCLLWTAARIADDIPSGRNLFCTVFFRQRTLHPIFDVGVQMQSLDDLDEPPIQAIFGTMDTIEGGLIDPAEGVSIADAEAVGTLAMRKNYWAALRGLELSDDATRLILPELQTAA